MYVSRSDKSHTCVLSLSGQSVRQGPTGQWRYNHIHICQRSRRTSKVFHRRTNRRYNHSTRKYNIAIIMCLETDD